MKFTDCALRHQRKRCNKRRPERAQQKDPINFCSLLSSKSPHRPTRPPDVGLQHARGRVPQHDCRCQHSRGWRRRAANEHVQIGRDGSSRLARNVNREASERRSASRLRGERKTRTDWASELSNKPEHEEEVGSWPKSSQERREAGYLARPKASDHGRAHAHPKNTEVQRHKRSTNQSAEGSEPETEQPTNRANPLHTEGKRYTNSNQFRKHLSDKPSRADLLCGAFPDFQRDAQVKLVETASPETRLRLRAMGFTECAQNAQPVLVVLGMGATSCSTPPLLACFCPRGAVWWSLSARSIATVIRSCRSHERSRRCRLRAAAVAVSTPTLVDIIKAQLKVTSTKRSNLSEPCVVVVVVVVVVCVGVGGEEGRVEGWE